ncbi:MAG TPA: AbiV family abortive infection protein [Pyrinomonadaceae bacterium]
MVHILNKHGGKLTVQQIVEGINAVMSNAQGLFQDAVLLLEHGRFPRAASLAILSIEEVGKTIILRRMALTEDQDDIDGLWKEFTRHHAKNAPAAFVNRLMAGDRTFREMKVSLENKGGECSSIDQLKQLGFYVDCDKTIRWLTPSDQVTESIALHYVGIAGGLVNQPETTIRDIELFVKHFKTAWGGSADIKKQAFLNWVQEYGQISQNSFQFVENLFS